LSNPNLGVAIGAHGDNDGEGPHFGAGLGEGEAATVELLLACSAGPIEAAVSPQAASDTTSPTAVMTTLPIM